MLYNHFAAAYGTSTYSASTYQDTAASTPVTTTPASTATPVTTATTAAASQPTQTGVLSDTGLELFAAATLACVIIFATLIVRFARRKSPTI